MKIKRLLCVSVIGYAKAFVAILPLSRRTTISPGSTKMLMPAEALDTASDGRRSFISKIGIGSASLLATIAVTDEAGAVDARPSAKGLAETSIELTGSGSEPVEVTLLYPAKWTVTKNAGKGISIQDYKFADRAFSMSIPLPSGTKDINDLPISFYTDAIFDLNGPYGTFGKVDDYKVIGAKTLNKGKRKYRYVDLKFAALTQGLLQVDRRACVASTIVGNDVVLLTASVLASRWGKVSDTVAEMIESYRAGPLQKVDPSKMPFNRS